jgi:hypothetical protein
MWLDDLKPGDSWTGVWSTLSHCAKCHALTYSSPCPLCGNKIDSSPQRVVISGVERRIVSHATQGAIAWSTYVLMQLMQREWERPLAERDFFGSMPAEKRPSQRFAIVLLFWTLFEGLIDKFMDTGLADLPDGVRNDLLRRFSTIGSRLDRLYRLIWSTTFWDDLRNLGFGTEADHLKNVQEWRNAFVHGNPESIDDGLVQATVEHLQTVQQGWIAVYNLRCTRKTKWISASDR